MRRWFPCLCLAGILAGAAEAQGPSPGQTLISRWTSVQTYSIDLAGNVQQTWTGASTPASIGYLLGDGSILRPCVTGGSFSGGGIGGRVQQIDGNNDVVWDFTFATNDHHQHHDIEPMPNGNVLLLAWERKTNAEALAAGRQSLNGDLWPTLIVEIEPVGATGGNIVWEWHFWDHLVQDVDPGKPNFGVVADHPELLDINWGTTTSGGDWVHANAIDYDPVRDEIVFCSRYMHEVYVIDHSTTTEEAAGHTGGNRGMGGDILYRWGNPRVYDRGTTSDQYFFAQHGANWIDEGMPGAGNILVFNNGDRAGSANDYSTVDELAPPRDVDGNYVIDDGLPFGPTVPTWSHGGPGEFYGGSVQNGAFRLPNGNTLVCLFVGDLFEVTSSGDTVWQYDAGGTVARAQRYGDAISVPPDHELDPGLQLTSRRNPFRTSTNLEFEIPEALEVRLAIYDVVGRRVAVLVNGRFARGIFDVIWAGRDDHGRDSPPGVYFARLDAGTLSAVRRVVLTR